MAEILKKAMDVTLDHKDPKRKLERRLAKKQKREAGGKAKDKLRPRPDEVAQKDSGTESEVSRHVGSEVRERVQARASYQCQCTGASGRRCTERTGVQLEHGLPFAIYRTHDERFLEVLCRRHNFFRAEKTYGSEFIRAKIEERRRRGSARGSGG